MKLLQSLLPIATLLTFSVRSQDTLIYSHCNCIDIIDKIAPSPSGSYARVCDNITIEKGTFLSGEKTGEWLSYSSNGDVIKKINYSNGTLNGDLSYYHNNGMPKLSGSFSKGLKTGDWKFYNQKGKVQWSQTFNEGIPTGLSLIYDAKGKKVMISFDYDKNEFVIKNEEFSLFETAAEIMQDPTSSEWFIILLSDPTKKTAELSLDQTNIDSELFMSLMEIPSDFFDTYTNVNYNVEMEFKDFGLQSIDVKRESSKGEEYPLFAFGVMTNDPEKLIEIEHSEFTLSLLDSKIKEALSIFAPWQIENGKFSMGFLYVVNKIEGREVYDQY